MTLPNIEILVIVTDGDGVNKTFDSQAPDPGDRPRGIRFATQLGSGFYTGSFSLSRAIDRDNDDIHVLDAVQFVLASGETVYEGYITDLPRSMDSDGHTLDVNIAGWIQHVSDEPFTEIFVDRDLSAWGPGSSARRGVLLPGFGQIAAPSVSPDPSGRQALITGFTGAWAAAAQPISEAWYDIGQGNSIGRITATWTKNLKINHGDPNYQWDAVLCTDDLAAVFDWSGNLLGGGPAAVNLPASTDDRRYALLQVLHQTAAGGIDGTDYAIEWSDVAVHGNQGIPLVGATAPYAVGASDVIRYLAARYAPLLDAAGVADMPYPISHVVFRDVTLYDALLQLNSYAYLWAFAVWEDRTLHYAPIDLTDWDWEFRHDEVGNQIGLHGDSVTDLRNGIIVTFTNAATGMVERLHPDAYDELRDDSIDNPANAHGRRMYGQPYTIPFATTRSDALELGRLKLLEDNQVKGPGQFTKTAHVKDRSEQTQPVCMVRAGDRGRLTSSANLSDRPRLIHETSYDHDTQTLTTSVDAPARSLDVFVDRVQTALLAAGLS
jgi:hypothetical protein